MFVGHFAPAIVLASRKDAPSLPVLFFGAQLVDWGFFTLLLFGVEQMRIVPGITVMNPFDLYHMPYTHSLLGSLLWAALFAILIFAFTRKRGDALIGAMFGAVIVLSHWFLDWLVHRPDLTLLGVPPKLGLGLWNHPWIEIPLELGITFGALWLYARMARPDRKRLFVFAGLLLGLQLTDWLSPPPPGVSPMLSVMAMTAYALATLCAWWVDRSRRDKVRWAS